ncbi:MAG: cadmium-translocating P-type ATPase [Anaerolineae bacterium]|jgi:Zn2+/Cd2+-exporting ATPase|nr:cadmium-translocating P-type ATPase [Anaerolineae bacterium]MBT7069262.1 cadmium-translocating P-type ATPase [Anaerolineae bacterium]MBT7326515.1 cadmium-translocating P-type ATPase [Anaerolineae bacterium]
MTTTELETLSPPIGARCTDVLSDTLEGYAGIESVEFDLESGQLKATFDQRIISNESALQVINKAGEIAATRVGQCVAKAEHGHAACAGCAGQMGEMLVAQYQAAATLPIANIQGGVIEASLNQPHLAEGEISIAQASLSGNKIAETKKIDFSIAQEKKEVALTILTLLTALVAFIGTRNGMPTLTIAILYGVAYVAGGWYGVQASLDALREKTINVDLLMILAAIGAALIGQPAEGAILLFLFSLSNTLQSYAMDRSRKAIEKLLDLRPATATLKRGEKWIDVPIDELLLGDTVIVRPGERFPIDGSVTHGQSEVDQAAITGESVPVHKDVDDKVFAGTVNGTGALEIKVTRLAKDTTLARIVQMVEDAQSTKAQTQRMLDDFEQVYAIIVLAAAALLIVVPYFLLGEAFQPVFYRAMTWLVVASPCALVISTPASFLSAIANGARNGVLFKGGVHLEKTATLKVLAFDKTGTLTHGMPKITALIPLSNLDEDELLRLTAALEARSEHPLARSIVRSAHERDLNLPLSTSFRSVPGQGVEGKVEGKTLWIGNERLFEERGVAIPADVLSRARAIEDEGQTVMYAYSAPEFLGLVAVADTLREDAVEMIKALKVAGIERVVMLTGDNPRVAAKIAERAGVDEYHANLLPQDKVTVLKTLQNKYGPVAMVGDGVNDAPSLATADIGIAMGGAGTDVAIETADVVLMSDDLQKIPFAIGLARRAKKVVWQNLVFALAVIVLLVVSAFGANLALPLGVIGHEGSTVLVVLNGLRLLGYKG